VQLRAREHLVATAAYQPEPVAAAAARRFVRDTLRSWPLTGRPSRRETLIDDAVLLTSELVTNAVVHAGTCVHVTCRLLAGTVEIAVLDERPAQVIPDRPQPPADPAERTSGRGLQLPSELASAWGVTYAQAAKAVWFRLSLPGQAAGQGRTGLGAAVLDRPGLDGETLEGAGLGGAALDRAARDGAALDGAARDGAALDGAARDGASRDGAVIEEARVDGAGPPDRGLAGPAPSDGTPDEPGPAGAAWPSRRPSRPGYEELLSGTAEEGRAVAGADIAYLLDAGEDGELRVRAVAGAGQPWLAPGSVTYSAARALAGSALSLVTVPLIVDDRVTGVLAVACAEPGRFTEQQAARLQELADRVAPVLERARLSELEQSRQERAAFLEQASQELSAAADPEKVAAIGARLGAGQVASWCAILADCGGELRLVSAAHADPALTQALDWLLRHAQPPPARASDRRGARHGGRHVGRHGGRRWSLDLPADVTGPVPPGLADLTTGQAWCFPVETGGEMNGLLVIGGPGALWPAREARELAAGLARRIGAALERG
jgi:GAF domain-containing protein/anti-sigma regulatory factor (Ser/Thr protein kinase)